MNVNEKIFEMQNQVAEILDKVQMNRTRVGDLLHINLQMIDEAVRVSKEIRLIKSIQYLDTEIKSQSQSQGQDISRKQF